MMKNYIILFDIDGVLADWSHRLHLEKGSDEFYAAMQDDPILPSTVIYNLMVVFLISGLNYDEPDDNCAHKCIF
jgi:FMN phosphatase YigB (HAD superfamily)